MAQVVWYLVKLWGWLAWVIFLACALVVVTFLWMLVFWTPLYLLGLL